MKAVIQRVSEASVEIEGLVTASIQHGVLVLLGIAEADAEEDITWLAEKLCHLRIFSDETGNMNRSIHETAGDVLLVSQFTLLAAVTKGKRPSFVKAAPPELAVPLYEKFISTVESILGKKINTGRFGAHMKVGLVNDGPVTILLDSKRRE